jgi:hypothetical protein
MKKFIAFAALSCYYSAVVLATRELVESKEEKNGIKKSLTVCHPGGSFIMGKSDDLAIW